MRYAGRESVPYVEYKRNQISKYTLDKYQFRQQAVRDALIGFLAATAQAQAEATKEAQRAGIDHARAKADRYRGRKPSYRRDQYEAVRDLLAQQAGTTTVAKTTGLSRQTVLRIKADPAGTEAALSTWRM